MSRKHIDEVKNLLEEMYKVADILEEKGIHSDTLGFSENDRLRDVMQKDIITFMLRLPDDDRRFNDEAMLYICEILNKQLYHEHIVQLMQASKKLTTPAISVLLPYMIFMDSKLGRTDLSSTYVRTLGASSLTLIEILDDVELQELLRYNKNCRDCISLVEKSLGIKMDYDPLQSITSHQRELVKYATMADEVVNGNETTGVNTVAGIIKSTSLNLGSEHSEKNTDRITENEDDKLKYSNEFDEETPIDFLNLSPSSQFRLKHVGVKTVESLYSMSVKDLKLFRCFGRKEFNALLDTLNEDYLRRYGSCSVRVKSLIPSGIPIENLELSVRAYNCLKRAKIDTVEDLLDKTVEDLIRVRNLGRKCAEEVVDKVKDFLYSDEWNRLKRKMPEYSLIVDNNALDGSIDELDLSVRTYNYLKRKGINTVGDLTKLTIYDVRQVYKLNQAIGERILEVLRQKGFVIRTFDWNEMNNGSELVVADDVLLGRGIDWLDIELKTLLSLRNAGINKLGDLCRMMAYEVMSIRNLKPIEVVRIETALREYRLSLMESA